MSSMVPTAVFPCRWTWAPMMDLARKADCDTAFGSLWAPVPCARTRLQVAKRKNPRATLKRDAELDMAQTSIGKWLADNRPTVRPEHDLQTPSKCHAD